jgi:hypothetical protein
VGQSVGQMPFLGRNFGTCKFRIFLKSDFKNRGALRPLRLGWMLRCSRAGFAIRCSTQAR